MQSNLKSVKPAVEQALILALLDEHFKQPIQDSTPVQDGLVAKTRDREAYQSTRKILQNLMMTA